MIKLIIKLCITGMISTGFVILAYAFKSNVNPYDVLGTIIVCWLITFFSSLFLR